MVQIEGEYDDKKNDKKKSSAKKKGGVKGKDGTSTIEILEI